MAIDSILSLIDEEIAKLVQIRALLATSGPARQTAVQPKAAKGAVKTATKGRRTLSPEARKRIADAQRKRWAAQRAR